MRARVADKAGEDARAPIFGRKQKSGGAARGWVMPPLGMHNPYCKLSSIDDFPTTSDVVNKRRIVKSAEKRHVAEIWQR